MNYRIYLSPPTHSAKDIDVCRDAVESNWLTTQGPAVNEFTDSLKYYFNREVLLTNSGTSAIHLALILGGVQKDDFVLCSNFTFIASAYPVLYQNAIPVFIGIDESTWNICPNYLTEAIQNCPKRPKALVLTHVYGMPANMELIKNICHEYDITLIEDAAESLGSKYQNEPVGVFGDFGIISFNGNKIITTSSGGALITKSKEKINLGKKIASQAKEPKDFYDHKMVGYNMLQSNILAALGNSQFESLSERVEKRRSIYNFYVEKLASFCNFQEQIEEKNSFSNRWLSSFVFEKGLAGKFKSGLQKNQIESRYLFAPLNKQDVFKGAPYFGNEIEEEFFKTGLSLPSGFELSVDNQEEIINILKNSL